MRRPRDLGGDHLRRHLRPHLEAAAAGLRHFPANGAPAIHALAHGTGVGKPHRAVLDRPDMNGELERSRCPIDPISVREAKGGPDRTEPDHHSKRGPKIRTWLSWRAAPETPAREW